MAKHENITSQNLKSTATLLLPLIIYNRRMSTVIFQPEFFAAITVATCQDTLSTGILPLRHGNCNIERLPPGSITSKGSMKLHCRI
jgi:hypothetical protein